MEIDLVYFGMAADATATSREAIHVNPPLNLATLRAHLATLHPKLKDMPYKIAQGTQLLSDTHILQDRCELVILPPFAGG